MIKNVIFDLDGTLWQTKQSYIYAYEKLCEKYNKTPIKGFEEVINYMGVKVDILLRDLFPEIVDQSNIINEALNYSIEYIMKYPEGTCFPDVYSTLKGLSENYNIYIISNCLKEYVETFMNISNTSSFIKGFYTIEKGEKADHLKNITNNFTEKSLFVGDDIEDYNQISDHSCVYFVYASYGYKDCDEYDYKINCLEELSTVLQKIIRKERILSNYRYEIISSNDTNLTLIEKEYGLCYFGFIETYSIDDLYKVINKLVIKSKGKKLVGPIDGNTFYNYRFAINNFDWKLYPDCKNSFEEYNAFIQSGFKIKQEYSSTLANINTKFYERSQRYTLSSEYKLLFVEGAECYKYLDDLYEVTIDAFSKADYYESISKEDFIELYLESIKLCNPDLFLIYHHDKLVAFHFCYEDLEKRFYVSKTVGIKKAYQFKNILLTIINCSYKRVIEKGYDKVLHHFMNDRTKTLQAIYRGYELNKKRFVLLEYNNED
ncbi:MAG: HAD family hydrolase [Bacilli bacterium]|nr:HAD family hydrolase [Bacilli bacterium]